MFQTAAAAIVRNSLFVLFTGPVAQREFAVDHDLGDGPAGVIVALFVEIVVRITWSLTDAALRAAGSAGSCAELVASRLTERVSAFEYEGDLHGDPVLFYLSVFNARLVLDHVKAGNTAQGSVGPRQPFAHGGIKAL